MSINNELITKINNEINLPTVDYWKIWYEFVWRTIVVIHFVIIILNMISWVIVPWYEPFYVSIPIISFEFNLIFSQSWDCPLTRFENYYRKLAGREPIGKFVKHYILPNIIYVKKKLNRNRSKN